MREGIKRKLKMSLLISGRNTRLSLCGFSVFLLNSLQLLLYVFSPVFCLVNENWRGLFPDVFVQAKFHSFFAEGVSVKVIVASSPLACSPIHFYWVVAQAPEGFVEASMAIRRMAYSITGASFYHAFLWLRASMPHRRSLYNSFPQTLT